jgi:hypothetical protein
MPSPFWPFICYGAMAVISLVVILAFNFRPDLVPHSMRPLQKADAGKSTYTSLPLYHHSTPSKDKFAAGEHRQKVKAALDGLAVAGTFLITFFYLNHALF